MAISIAASRFWLLFLCVLATGHEDIWLVNAQADAVNLLAEPWTTVQRKQWMDLVATPKGPNRRCDSGGARFTEPVVVDLSQPEYKKLSSNETSVRMRQVLASALNSSYPVLIRGSEEPGPLQAQGFDIVEKLCNTSVYPLTAMTRAFAPMSNLWGQMRETSNKDIEKLLRLLPSGESTTVFSATMSHFVELVTRHAAALSSANLTHIQASKFFPRRHCPSLHRRLLKEGWEPSYWHLPGWNRAERYVFVQPAGSAMAAHVDGGKSYFLLHVHRGRKAVRLWPVYSRVSPLGLQPPSTGQNEIESWMLAQHRWSKDVDPLVHIKACRKFGIFKNPCDPFLKGVQGVSLGKSEEDLAESNAHEVSSPHSRPQYGRGADAHKCFVEVQLGPGDQIFVPADTPHAIRNLEPTLSTGINYFPANADRSISNY